jgi:hypothetical protein
MISRNTRQNEQEYKDKRKEALIIFRQKSVLCKSKMGQMEIAFNNNKAQNFYQVENSIRKGFKPQTLLITDKEGNIVSNKEKVLNRWFEYYEKHFELQDGKNNDSEEEWTMSLQTEEPNVEPPNDVDNEMAIIN